MTMFRAMEEARWMSLPAPVEISPRVSCSATRPPSREAMRSVSSVRERKFLSSWGRLMVMPPAPPRGTMVI